VVNNDLPELLRERSLAVACGYDYTVGVLSAAHRDALNDASGRTLKVVVMDWCLR